MKLFSSDQIRAWDAQTISEGISSIDLMERASLALAERITREVDSDSRFAVFAGTGNNGGDALAVARLLKEKGHRAIDVFLVCPSSSRLSPDCAANLGRLDGVITIGEENEAPSSDRLAGYDLLIDGLFGSGLNRPLGGLFKRCVEAMNASSTRVVSIDIPSGLFADRGGDELVAVRADLVLTLQIPKRSFMFPASGAYVSDFEVLSIGLSESFHDQQECDWRYIQREDVALPPRRKFAHKGNFGHAIVCAGSRGMRRTAQCPSLSEEWRWTADHPRSF